jgi:hypothetical protein
MGYNLATRQRREAILLLPLLACRRIEFAKTLLAKHGESVTEIALAVLRATYAVIAINWR